MKSQEKPPRAADGAARVRRDAHGRAFSHRHVVRGATLGYLPASNRDALFAVVTLSCNRTRASLAVRDRIAKVSQCYQDMMDGAGM